MSSSNQLFILLFIVLIGLPSVGSADPLTIVIDPGHLPSAPGAEGSCGTREVDANDAATKAIQRLLQTSGNFKTQLTRESQKYVLPIADESFSGGESRESLIRRAEIANQVNAGAFISIHHDSVEPQYLIHDPQICRGHGGFRISDGFKKKQKIGFSIFVYQGDDSNKARFELSKFLATLIGKKLRSQGLVPSDYHQKPIEHCHSCRLLNAEFGVWNQDLAVLKKTRMPAILIEAHNIVDPEYERAVNSQQFRDSLALAIKQGLEEFFKNPAARAAVYIPSTAAR